MVNPRAFFHDRLVLLLLTINSFLLILISLSIIFRLGDTNEGYIAQYRSNLGLEGYKVGGLGQILSFIIFAVMVYGFQIYLGIRMYHIHKKVTYTILLLSFLLMVLTLVISYSLLGLR